MEQQQDQLLTLLAAIKNGEENAVATLYDLTVNRVYGLAIRIVSRPELAEEVVGDVFTQVWQNPHAFNSEIASPIAWLMMICRSRSLDKLRREKSATRNQYPQDEEHKIEDTMVTTPEEDLKNIEHSSLIIEALKILNDKQRQMIRLAFYKGMSQQEISDYTGEPLGTVKSNLRRAQLVLKNTLSEKDFELGDTYGKA